MLNIYFLIFTLFLFSTQKSILCSSSNGKASLVAQVQDEDLLIKFELYKKRFNKQYAKDEEQKRFGIYKENLQRAAEMQEKIRRVNPYSDAEFGENSISDVSQKEFLETHLGLLDDNVSLLTRIMINRKIQEQTQASADNRQEVALEGVLAYPASYDARALGYVTPVKNQKSCGNCYAFGAIALVESAFIKAGIGPFDLSEQQITSCDSYNRGCSGGQISLALDYIKNTGLTSENSYPYTSMTGSSGSCLSSQIVKPLQTIVSYTSKDIISESNIQDALLANGSVLVGMDASVLSGYKSGVIDGSSGCSKYSVNHAVLIVGYGSNTNSLNEKIDYWIIKNSWGEGWGIGGFFYLIKGKGACGILRYMFNASVSSS